MEGTLPSFLRILPLNELMYRYSMQLIRSRYLYPEISKRTRGIRFLHICGKGFNTNCFKGLTLRHPTITSHFYHFACPGSPVHHFRLTRLDLNDHILDIPSCNVDSWV